LLLSGSPSSGFTCAQVVDGGEGLQVWRVVVNIVKPISVVLVCIVFVQLPFITYCLKKWTVFAAHLVK